MRYFITGANSFVGNQITTILDNLSINWIGIDRSISLNPKILNLDINSIDLHEYINKNDIVIHLAALSSDSECLADINEALNTNISGTINVLNASIKSKAKKLLFASTEWVYGDHCSILQTENNRVSLHNLNSIYSKTKLICENILESRGINEIDIIIYRFSIIYGKRKNKFSAFESIIQKCIFENEITIGSKITARRFIDVYDLARTIIENSVSEKSGIYNISGSNLISLNDIISTCEILLDKNIKIIETNSFNPTIRNVYTMYDRYKNINNKELSEIIKPYIEYYA